MKCLGALLLIHSDNFLKKKGTMKVKQLALEDDTMTQLTPRPFNLTNLLKKTLKKVLIWV